jgi:resuscitation-promoting factor RpfB
VILTIATRRVKSILFARCSRIRTAGRTGVRQRNIRASYIIALMRINRGLVLSFVFFLFACQPAAQSRVTIIDNGRVTTLQTVERVPSAILSQAGITLGPKDRVLVNGLPILIDQTIPVFPVTLQIRRVVTLTLATPEGEKKITSSASTVGDALADASIWLRENDKVFPGFSSSITDGMKITLIPARQVTLNVDGKVIQIETSAKTVGEALAEAGIPLLGLDYSIPQEQQPLPNDGQITLVRVSESLQLAQKPIPFDSEVQASAEVPLDQTQILQPGESGLSVQRIRIRYEDGKEISRLNENETVVRPPRTRVLGYGTKVEVKKAGVDGREIEYWRAVQMYATSYSPCRSGGDRCYPGTASGKSLKKGMVGVQYDWYLAMGGQQLYIPGYGLATIEDVCNGCRGKAWIDLGYSDNDWQQWNSWVTVYFLTPVPSNIIYDLQ